MRAGAWFKLFQMSSVIELARLHAAKVLLIEDAPSGTALFQSLRSYELIGVPSPIPRRPEGDKVARVMNVSAMIRWRANR